LFWDDYHPTTAAHKQVENLAYFVIKAQSQQAQMILQPNPRTQISQPQLAQLIFSQPGIRD
jgi:phospholipase/lecithinase/hemolysin